MDTDVYIFGYQSILATGSLATSVGMGTASQQLIPARLAGYARCWSAVRHFSGNETKRYLHSEDWHIAERVAFANLAPSTDSFVNGACFRVPIMNLSDLDFREQGYKRIGISDHVEPYTGYELNKSIPCHTYIDPAPSRDSAMVSRDYYEMGRSGAASIDKTVPGFLADYLSSTNAPEILVDDLVFVFFSNDGQHLWLLEEADSSLVLLHRFSLPQVFPSSRPPTEMSRHVTSGLEWLDVRSRALTKTSAHKRIPLAMIEELISGENGGDVSGSRYWLCRLIAADLSTSPSVLATLANDPDFWVRRATQLRTTTG